MGKSIIQCQHCGGWYKEIVDNEGNVERVCAKCGRFDYPDYEKRVEDGRRRHEKFDKRYRKINRDRSSLFRTLLLIEKFKKRRVHV